MEEKEIVTIIETGSTFRVVTLLAIASAKIVAVACTLHAEFPGGFILPLFYISAAVGNSLLSNSNLMAEFFQFEADFIDSLRCIPMQVRMKLDTCGIKLKLSDWNHLTFKEREVIAELPCTNENQIQAYRQFLNQSIVEHTGALPKDLPVESHPDWIDAAQVPLSVQEKAHEFGTTVTIQQWASLSPLQRFALIKLSRSSHENKNFLPALKEFHLV